MSNHFSSSLAHSQASHLKSVYSKQRGFAAVETVIVSPVLLLILVGLIELIQMIQANYLIISVSREGANIISRSSTETPQDIMDIVASTSSPLDLSADGNIYITLVVGQDDDDPYVSSQHRWDDFGYSVDSGTWGDCANWDNDDQCELDEDNLPTLSNFAIDLGEGESVYVVEVLYEYNPAFSFFLESGVSITDTTYL
ncbi:TadE/TadG family type IV pilus assembly protein [Vibrio gallaecicus]|uniref:TadE/TadG family type IV pilus assembly protein n=1 Tax=Vibrio gallaecicus TaxID=552386 RepID=A0ABV4N803_9VIBR